MEAAAAVVVKGNPTDQPKRVSESYLTDPASLSEFYGSETSRWSRIGDGFDTRCDDLRRHMRDCRRTRAAGKVGGTASSRKEHERKGIRVFVLIRCPPIHPHNEFITGIDTWATPQNAKRPTRRFAGPVERNNVAYKVIGSYAVPDIPSPLRHNASSRRQLQ